RPDPLLLDEIEGLDELLDGRVLRAVRDHDDLEARVVQAQERAHRGDDRALLVVRGHEDRDRLVDLALDQIAQRDLGDLARVGDDLAQAAVAEQRVEQVQHGEVAEDEVLVAEGQRGEVLHAATRSGVWTSASRRTWPAMSRPKRSGWARAASRRRAWPSAPWASMASAAASRTPHERSPSRAHR